MTVKTTVIKAGPYPGDGVSFTFAYGFRVKDKTQLSVYETDDLGVQTILTVDTDYTVNGIGVNTGGTVDRAAGALPVNYEWFIRANYKLTQLTALPSQGPFFPEIHEDVFDKHIFISQQQEEAIARSYKAPIDDDGQTDFTLPGYAAKKALIWDTTEQKLVNSVDDFDSAAAEANASAAAALVSENNALISENTSSSILFNIQSVHLVSGPSDPSLDGNGNPVTFGDWYINSVSFVTRFFDGTSWRDLIAEPVIAVYPLTSGTSTDYILTIGATSLIVNGSYRMRVHTPNTGSSTITIDALGTYAILTTEGQPVSENQLINVIDLFYDGIDFILAYSGQVSVGDIVGLGLLATKNTVASVDIDNDSVITSKIPDNAIITSKIPNANITEVKLSAAVAAKLVPGGAGHTQPSTSITGLGSLATKSSIVETDIAWSASNGMTQGNIKDGGTKSSSGYATVFTTKLKIPPGATNIEYWCYQSSLATGTGAVRLSTNTNVGTTQSPTSATLKWDGPFNLVISDKSGWTDILIQIAGSSSPATTVTLDQIMWSYT